MKRFRITVHDSFFNKYFICEEEAPTLKEAQQNAREIYAVELDTHSSDIVITDSVLITDFSRPVYRHNSQDYFVKIVGIDDGFIFFIVQKSENPLFKSGEKLKAREKDFALNYTASHCSVPPPAEPRRQEIDPETKYYRDYATFLERFADMDSDGQED